MELTKTDSLAIKGIAICLMLCWHLFYCPNPVGIEFGDITKAVGIVGDTCVSMFVFISGYGLSKAYFGVFKETEHCIFATTGSLTFVLKRLIKFYSNFWFVFLLFVPIGVYIFNIPMIHSDEGVISNIQRIMINLFLGGSYNPNWWFNGLIVVLYVLFPVIYPSVRYSPSVSMIGALLLVDVGFYFVPVNIGIYVFVFIMGIYLSINGRQLTETLRLGCISDFKKLLFVILLGGAVVALLIHLENRVSTIYSTGIRLYNILTLLFVAFVVYGLRYLKFVYSLFSILGKHSANIYWTHQFIFYFWFPDFIFSPRNPLLIFILLLTVSLFVSVAIEKLKNAIGFYVIQERLCKSLSI